MKLLKKLSNITVAIGVLAASASAQTYDIKITNLTKGQRFTPRLVVVHRSSVSLFEVGQPASSGLATLAEEGNVTPIETTLSTTRGVRDTAIGADLLAPGGSQTVRIQTKRGDRVSLAAMLIPTNDAFVALNGVDLPLFSSEYYLPAYDAGSEVNDELCASIPGPNFSECGGNGGGGSPTGGEEGFVSISNGMHGIGNFSVAERDWRNPVAKVEITRVGK